MGWSGNTERLRNKYQDLKLFGLLGNRSKHALITINKIMPMSKKKKKKKKEIAFVRKHIIHDDEFFNIIIIFGPPKCLMGHVIFPLHSGNRRILWFFYL